jgi:hypothetical protein
MQPTCARVLLVIAFARELEHITKQGQNWIRHPFLIHHKLIEFVTIVD